jgi:hypothetical protein
MQSIALLMGQLLGWDPVRALEELNICLETWYQDGYRLSAWKDAQGLVHVNLPKKTTLWGPEAQREGRPRELHCGSRKVYYRSN